VFRGETLNYIEELRQKGCLIAAEPLQSVQTAATVRVPELYALDHRRPVEAELREERRYGP
jgi:hypothetical protein